MSEDLILRKVCAMRKRGGTPASARKVPGFRSSTTNACHVSAIHRFGARVSPLKRGRDDSDDDDEDDDKPPASVSMADRITIFDKYYRWKILGSKLSDSPIAGIIKDFGVERNYPARLHKKFFKTGSLADHWHVEGRPKEFRSPTKKALLEIAEEQAEKQERSSAPHMRKTLVKRGDHPKVPSESTIRRLKHEMKFSSSSPSGARFE